ncbi:TetR/AcrR family transcriptional regulator [Companilactobacillus mishanensis]|uniref:TetR/AcrR family transcriptional regulator n=1 Tax=Companilactobacillus mishanensis TaxID=2486008 RepID=UPI000F78464A|nr:TetR/AcrR family transcriptional regulator [Companilactobacillus mishanensis]
MTNRAKAAAATRNNLIENADRLLYEKGYQDMSIVDITKSSGVAKGTFYNYFDTKEDLLLELSKRHLGGLTEEISTFSKQQPKESIRNYMIAYVKIVMASGDNMARSWIRFVVDPKNQIKWQFDLESLENLIRLLVENQKLDQDIPVRRIAEMLITEIYGIIFSWCISPDTINPVDSVKSFCDLQLESILQNYTK